jgi:hypothetical protein
VATGKPLISGRGRGLNNSDHRKLADEVPQGTFGQCAFNILHSRRDIEQVSLLLQLFQCLRQWVAVKNVDLVAKPSRESSKLAQFLVGMRENTVRKKMETIKCLHDSIELGSVQPKDIT